MKNIENKYGEIIREARQRNNMTISQLAESVGISDRYMQKIENENKIPSQSVLKKLINILYLDANVFYYDDYNNEQLETEFIFRKIRECTPKEIRIIEVLLKAFQSERDCND